MKGKAAKNTSTTQSFTLQNASSSAIAGPVSIALDSLTAGVTLLNAAGVTSCAAPAGSPYVNVDVGSDSVWSPGERVDVVLQFERQSTGPGKKPGDHLHTTCAGRGGWTITSLASALRSRSWRAQGLAHDAEIRAPQSATLDAAIRLLDTTLLDWLDQNCAPSPKE